MYGFEQGPFELIAIVTTLLARFGPASKYIGTLHPVGESAGTVKTSSSLPDSFEVTAAWVRRPPTITCATAPCASPVTAISTRCPGRTGFCCKGPQPCPFRL